MSGLKCIYVVGTCDTKGAEMHYAGGLIRKAGAKCTIVDVSTGPGNFLSDVSAAEVAKWHPVGQAAVLGLSDRGRAVTAMAEALTRYILSRDDVGGILGMGGSGNSTIVTAAMRALPIGLPKLMVSTLASGNVASFVGPSDITMMHSVGDVAGLNAISRQVIGNAAHAMAGMFLNHVPKVDDDKLPIGLTKFAKRWKGPASALCSMPPEPVANAWKSWWTPAIWRGLWTLQRRKLPIISLVAFYPATMIGLARSYEHEFPMSVRSVLLTWSISAPGKVFRKSMVLGLFTFTTHPSP
jgi:Uncharacterised protein family (UPF0261)